MLLKDALTHFNGNIAAMSRAIGHANPFNIYNKWGPVVPYKSACKLEELTGGKCKVDPQYYKGMLVAPEYRKLAKDADLATIKKQSHPGA